MNRTLGELASRLGVRVVDAALGSLALHAVRSPGAHRRALEWATRLPGRLTRAAIGRVSALALAVAGEGGPRVDRVLADTDWIARESWAFIPRLAVERVAGRSPSELIELMEEATTDRERWFEHPRVKSEKVWSVTLPGAVPTTVAYRFRDAVVDGREVPTVDVSIGPATLLFGPELEVGRLDARALSEHLRQRGPFYRSGRIDPVKHLGLSPRAASVLPGLLLLGEALAGTRRFPLSEWYVPCEPGDATLILSPRRIAIVRGPGPLAFALARAVNAQAGAHRHQHLYAAYRTYFRPESARDQGLVKPPEPGFPRSLLRAYGELSGADLKFEELERRSDHGHGPAASLIPAPDLELTGRDRRELLDALNRLLDALTSWYKDARRPPLEDYFEAAEDLLRAAEP